MTFTPDGRYLFVPANAHNFLDTQGKRQPETLLHNVFGIVGNGTFCVACDSPIEANLVVTNILTKECAAHKQNGCVVTHGAVSTDGESLYVAVSLPWPPDGVRVESEIRVFSTDPFRKHYTFGRQAEQFHRLAVSMRGDRLIAWGPDGLRVWDVTTKRSSETPLTRVRPLRTVSDFALSADGSQLATVDGAGLTIWDAASGEQIVHSGKHRRAVHAVACHPSKPVLATGDKAGNVFLWDHAGNILTRYDWGLGAVDSLCFAPDGLRCAAADAKGKVVVWDVDV